MKKLPNFFLVGAVKAGTTSLHSILSQHPAIYMAPIKEPNFFSQSDMRPASYASHYYRSISFNLTRYLKGSMRQNIHIADVSSWDDYCLLFKNIRDEVAIGEGSNSYLFCPSAPRTIGNKFPDSKILMILRNPVERAWSHYLMNRKLGRPVKNDFLEEFRIDTQAELQGWGITSNYFRLGLYAEQLQRFLAVFPRHRVKVILYDDFQRLPYETLAGVFEFLEVDPNYSPDIETQKNTATLPRWPFLYAILFQNSLAFVLKRSVPTWAKNLIEKTLFTDAHLPKLQESDRRVLIELYDSDIKQLADILDYNLDHWCD